MSIYFSGSRSKNYRSRANAGSFEGMGEDLKELVEHIVSSTSHELSQIKPDAEKRQREDYMHGLWQGYYYGTKAVKEECRLKLIELGELDG